MSPLMAYGDVLTELGGGRRGRIHLLLGNGFSIACDRRFGYDNLYSIASAVFSDRVKQLFLFTGENNFEGVLKLIDNSIRISEIYNNDEHKRELEADRDIIRERLVTSLVDTHMVNTGELSDAKKQACGNFLRPYHNVFTTNYDLLLYWVEMANDGLQGNDGFRDDDQVGNADYVVFTERAGGTKSIFYLHGALHIYRKEGQLRKHTWCRTSTPLIEGIRNGFALSQYPLFVSEGTSEKKMQQISGDPYLDYCLGKLGRVDSAVVALGMSFAENDNHILKVLKKNTGLRSIYVGLFGGENTPANQAIIGKFNVVVAERADGRHPLTVKFFDSGTANIWG